MELPSDLLDFCLLSKCEQLFKDEINDEYVCDLENVFLSQLKKCPNQDESDNPEPGTLPIVKSEASAGAARYLRDNFKNLSQIDIILLAMFIATDSVKNVDLNVIGQTVLDCTGKNLKYKSAAALTTQLFSSNKIILKFISREQARVSDRVATKYVYSVNEYGRMLNFETFLRLRKLVELDAGAIEELKAIAPAWFLDTKTETITVFPSPLLNNPVVNTKPLEAIPGEVLSLADIIGFKFTMGIEGKNIVGNIDVIRKA